MNKLTYFTIIALLLARLAVLHAEENATTHLPAFRYHGVVLEAANLKYRPHNDLIFPSVVRVEGRMVNPLGKFYLYYAPHDTPGGICLAYADRPEGPWREYGHNPIIARTWEPHYTASHVSGPDAIWNEEEGKLFLYFHGENSQTRLAASTDGIHFNYADEVINTRMFAGLSEVSYGRVFRHSLPGRDNRYIMLLMGNDGGTRRIYLAWSRDGRKWEVRAQPLMNPPLGTDQIAGTALLTWDGKFYLIAHANNSNANFNEGYDLYAAETDAALEIVRPLGKFFERASVSPTNPGVMSPCFIQDGGRLCMFFNIGARLQNKIALAIAEPGVPLAALHAAEAPAKKPNILWLIAEDMSPHFGCYGERTIQTPNVDKLATNGVLFERAFVTGPICSPSRSALITGMYQTSIGAQHHRSGVGMKIELPSDVSLIPRLFQQAGYHTSNGGYYPVLKKGKTDYNFEYKTSCYDGTDWMTRKTGQPFFAQIQLLGGKTRDLPKELAEARKQFDTVTPTNQLPLPPYYPRTPAILDDWAATLDAVRITDKYVGEIVERLRKEGILEQTIIFFISDHGVSHGRGKQFLYDEGTHIPFVVSGPSLPQGQRRKDLIEHIDMAAMSLALAGIPLPKTMQARNALAPDYQPREATYSARDRADETVDHIRSVRTERWKYIRNFLPKRPYLQPNDYKDHKPCLIALRAAEAAGQLNDVQRLLFAQTRAPEEFYDLAADPWEVRNLAADTAHAETLEKLRAKLDRWMELTNDQGRTPEPESRYDAEMAVYQGRKPNPKVTKNIAVMKLWATEGK